VSNNALKTPAAQAILEGDSILLALLHETPTMSITDSAYGVPPPVTGATTLHNARQKTHGIYH
jgi:hypothetical protein